MLINNKNISIKLILIQTGVYMVTRFLHKVADKLVVAVDSKIAQYLNNNAPDNEHNHTTANMENNELVGISNFSQLEQN